MTGDIGDQKTDPIFVDKMIIIQITADMGRWLIPDGKLHVFHFRQFSGDKRFLYISRYDKLVSDQL